MIKLYQKLKYALRLMRGVFCDIFQKQVEGQAP